MIKAIEIGDTCNGYINKYDNNLKYLNNLNKINIFIGENNSGKSRLIRYILSSKDTKTFEEIFNEQSKKNYDNAKKELHRLIDSFNLSAGSNKKINIPKNFESLDDSNYYCEIYNYIYSLGIDISTLNSNLRSNYISITNSLDEMCKYATKKNNSFSTNSVSSCDVTYIPILRGIENFRIYYELNHNKAIDTILLNEEQRQALDDYKSNAQYTYLNKTAKAYTIERKKIFTAENLFDEVKNKLLGEEKDRKFISEFEEFISNEFYDGEGFTIIPQIKSGYLNVKIGTSQERPLHNLGDGIKQLITIFYAMFEKRNMNAIFFIEEPEMNLHPGYQRHFMKIIENYKGFKNHQIFITTHSNHLIDSCLNYDNISLYKFINVDKSNSKFKVLNTTQNDIELLETLGVHNSSVFMANCSIWIEGISDKILLSQYLKVYFDSIQEKEFKEDIHYSFIEYGGNNITHWAFMPDDEISTINSSGVTNRSFIICDNDNDTKKARKEHIKSIFGDDNYCELTVREIENTIKRNVLEKTLFGEKEIKIKKNYCDNEYLNKKAYMGEFIDNHYILSKKYSAKSGTINKKLEFALKVSKNINTIDDLTPQAKNLCKKIYEFIKKSNYKSR